MIGNALTKDESLASNMNFPQSDKSPVLVPVITPQVQEEKIPDYSEEVLLSVHAGEPLLHWIRFTGEYEKMNRCSFCGKHHESMVPISRETAFCNPCYVMLSSKFNFITEEKAQAYYITY